MRDNKLTRFVDSAQTDGAALRPARRSSPHQDESGGSQGIEIGELFTILRYEKWAILVTTVVVVAAVCGYTYTLDPIYEAVGIVRIDMGPQAAASSIAMVQERDLSSEVGVLQYNAELASRVIEKMHATEDALGERNKFPILYSESGTELKTNEVIARFGEVLSFDAMPSQNMIRITAESEVPEEASTIVNILSEQYQLFSREKARASVTAAREFLEDQSEKRREDIRRLERQWQNFAQTNQVVRQGIGGERIVAEYTELNSRREALKFELQHEKEALRLLQKQLAQFEPTIGETVYEEQTATGLRTEIRMLDERIGTLRADAAQYYVTNEGLEGDSERIRNEFPELYDKIQRIEGLEKRKRTLTDELVAKAANTTALPGVASSGQGTAAGAGTLERVGQIRSRITEQELRIGQLQAQIDGLSETIASYEPRLNQIPQQTIQREAIQRKLDQAEQFYQSISNELQRTIIAEESELGFVQLVRSAPVPAFPVRPDMQQNAILAILLGFGLGIGIAFLRHASHTEIHRPDDLLRHGYALTGVVPDMDNEIKKEFRGSDTVEIEGHTLSTRLLPILSPWSPVTENYRLIRTNLMYSEAQEPYGSAPKVMLVTSPEPGDGKTTTAVNLALTFVLSGKKVLLIDADMRRPSAHKLLGIERGPGLAEMLRENKNNQVVRRTYVDGLYFVPAGYAEDPPTEALDSERMHRLIELGKSRCDIVIIDTPPVLAASDPLVLAPHADATLVVTSAKKTDLSTLDMTRDMLEGVGAPIEGVIFNRFTQDDRDPSRYHYSYDEYNEYRMVS